MFFYNLFAIIIFIIGGDLVRHKVRRWEVLEKNKNKKGFTLIELLAVVAILAIVIGISYGVYIGVINKSK